MRPGHLENLTSIGVLYLEMENSRVLEVITFFFPLCLLSSDGVGVTLALIKNVFSLWGSLRLCAHTPPPKGDFHRSPCPQCLWLGVCVLGVSQLYNPVTDFHDEMCRCFLQPLLCHALAFLRRAQWNCWATHRPTMGQLLPMGPAC